jgi:carbonic anhydrase
MKSAVVVEMNDLLKRILNQDLEFYHYKGSLTSPPCTESVSWFVYPKVLPVKKDILKAFHSKWVDNKEFNATGAGNSRPVCELNDRKIFKIKPVIE